MTETITMEAVLIAALAVAFMLVMLAFHVGPTRTNRVRRRGRAIGWDVPAADA